MSNLIYTETHAGEPIALANARLIPFSKTLHVQIPGLWGGFIWERPASILVMHADGREEIIPIQDVTRYIVWGLLGATALVWLFTRNIMRQK